MRVSSFVAAIMVAVVALAGSCSFGSSQGVDSSPIMAADDPPASSPAPTITTTTAPVTTTTMARPAVLVGAEVLMDNDFDRLAGLRVGIIANHASVAFGHNVIDVLDQAPNVELTAIFAPEHGVRGTQGAGVLFGDTVDGATGVPVFSLYGDNRRPTPEMLANIDVLVYDLQDVGVRFYTYISTMGLAMQSAAENQIPFMVLDRPNPVGAVVAGFTREPDQASFISQFPIPAAYAMTAGELARAIQGEGWIEGLAGLELDVVQLDGWNQSMLWPDTGRDWVPPSSGLPEFENALAYPGTVLFEATSISYGGGMDETFAIFGADWADGHELAGELNSRGLAGVEFEAVTFVPHPIEGRTTNPRLNGETLHGVKYLIRDQALFDPVASGLHVLQAFHQHSIDRAVDEPFINRPVTFDLLAGTDRVRVMLDEGRSGAEVVAAYQGDVDSFRAQREPYLLYG